MATKHADNYSKGEINIDTLPDAEQSNLDGANAAAATPSGPPGTENATVPVLAQPPPLPGRIISTKRFNYKRLKVALPHLQFNFCWSIIRSNEYFQLSKNKEINSKPSKKY